MASLSIEQARAVTLPVDLLARLSNRWDKRIVPIGEGDDGVYVAHDRSDQLNQGDLSAISHQIENRIIPHGVDREVMSELLRRAKEARAEPGRMIERVLAQAINQGVSDVFVSAGRVPMVSHEHAVQRLREWHEVTTAEEVREITAYLLGPDRWRAFDGDSDLAIQAAGRRFRLNVVSTIRGLSLSFRPIADRIPQFTSLGVSPRVLEFISQPRGLVIISGPTGSGKSTTLASMLELIGSRQNYKIVTLEDPIEYIFTDKLSIFDQRSVGPLDWGNDCESFSRGLRSAMRQRPDIIMVGEMRDRETFAAALEAAETGHLVVATLHTENAAEAFHRITSYFENSQAEIRNKLSQSLVGICVQRILPKIDGGLTVACEVLTMTNAVRTAVRDGNFNQLYNMLEAGREDGMQTFELSIAQLAVDEVIDDRTARSAISNEPAYQRHLSALKRSRHEG